MIQLHACRDVNSTNHSHLPTPNQSPIHLSLTLPLQLGVHLGHGIVYGTDVKWEVVSGNIITLDAMPPVESASYETQRSVALVFKLKQLPALQVFASYQHQDMMLKSFVRSLGDVYMFTRTMTMTVRMTTPLLKLSRRRTLPSSLL